MDIAPADIPDLRIPRAEYAERRRRLGADAAAKGLDGVLVWSREGTAETRSGGAVYLANYYTKFFSGLDDCPPSFAALGHAGVVVRADGDATLIVDMHHHYYPGAAVAEAIDSVIHDTNVVRGVAAAAKAKGLDRGRIGLVGSHVMSIRHFEALKAALPGVRWTVDDDLLAEPTAIKSEAEWRIIRYACGVANEVTDTILAEAVPGVTELSLSQRAAALMAERGCDLWWLRPLGLNRLKKGDVYFMSVVASCRGYFVDIARNKIVGAAPGDAPNATLKTLNDFILGQAAALLPGRTGAEAAAWGYRYFTEEAKRASRAEIEEGLLCPFPAFGHGLGLSYGRPYIRDDEPMPIRPGMYIAIEANLADPVLGMAEAEVDVEITADGPKVLTRL